MSRINIIRKIRIILTISATILILLAGMKNIYAQNPSGASAPTPVIAARVELKDFQDEVEALGTLKANESINLTSVVTETVTAVHFEGGQVVQKGDILVEMDASEERAELLEQQSFLEEAKRQVKRLEPLVKDGAASDSVLDEKRREVLVTEARIQAIQSRIDKREIKAPYDGIIGLRNISVGALTQPGTLLGTLDDVRTMKLDFTVPEIYLSALSFGTEIEARTDAFPDRLFTGTISAVNSRIDPVTRSITARALIDNSDGTLKPGLLMTVKLGKKPRQVLIVPEEALIADGSHNFILVIREKEDGTKTTERRKLKIGTRQFGIVEVMSGVAENELIVTHGTLRARPGAPVEITAIETQDEPLKELLHQKEEAQDDQQDDQKDEITP